MSAAPPRPLHVHQPKPCSVQWTWPPACCGLSACHYSWPGPFVRMATPPMTATYSHATHTCACPGLRLGSVSDLAASVAPGGCCDWKRTCVCFWKAGFWLLLLLSATWVPACANGLLKRPLKQKSPHCKAAKAASRISKSGFSLTWVPACANGLLNRPLKRKSQHCKAAKSASGYPKAAFPSWKRPLSAFGAATTGSAFVLSGSAVLH